MKRARFTGEQVIAILREHEAGASTADGVDWKPAIEWRSAYAQFTIFFPDRLPATIR